MARPRGDNGREMFLFSQGRRRGVLSLLTCNRNKFLIGEEGRVMVFSWQGGRGVSRLLSCSRNMFKVGVEDRLRVFRGLTTLFKGDWRLHL